MSIVGERFATEGRGLRTMRPLRRVGIEGACPVQGTGRPVIVRTLATLDARATGRRDALPMGTNRAAGRGSAAGFHRSTVPAVVSIVGDLVDGPWFASRGPARWNRSTGRGVAGRVLWRRRPRWWRPSSAGVFVCAVRNRRSSPIIVGELVDGERFATEGRGLRTMRPLRRVGIERACPVKRAGHGVSGNPLAMLDARATGRRDALPIGTNRAAGRGSAARFHWSTVPAVVSIVGACPVRCGSAAKLPAAGWGGGCVFLGTVGG